MGAPSKRQKKARAASNARREQRRERISKEKIAKRIAENIERLKRRKGQFVTKEEVRLEERHPLLCAALRKKSHPLVARGTLREKCSTHTHTHMPTGRKACAISTIYRAIGEKRNSAPAAP